MGESWQPCFVQQEWLKMDACYNPFNLLFLYRLQEYLEHIPFPDSSKTTSSDAEEAGQKVITLAIADTDSTIVYYRIANGLLSPELETEAAKEDKKNKRKKKKRKTGGETQEDESRIRCEEDKIDPFQEEEL